MRADPFQVLQANGPAARRPAGPRPQLVVAGATGSLGTEMLRRLTGSGRFDHTWVLAREPFTDGLAGVTTVPVAGDDPCAWPPLAAGADHPASKGGCQGVIMFDPPRLYHDRERALWTPVPAQLPALAAWMRAGGVQRLAVVLPHDQGRLPDALKRGLASLDEQAVTGLGFDCLILVRTAQKPRVAAAGAGGPLPRIAGWMLSVFQYMVPTRDQPVRPTSVAAFTDLALQLAPPGVHVAAPEQVWQAAQGDLQGVVRQWLAV